ncbi:hypothetical protein Tcan_16465, partial [Toxocara canis]
VAHPRRFSRILNAVTDRAVASNASGLCQPQLLPVLSRWALFLQCAFNVDDSPRNQQSKRGARLVTICERKAHKCSFINLSQNVKQQI